MQTQWSQVEDQEAQWISWNDSAVSTAELHASSEFTSRSSVEWREGVRTRLNTLWLLSMNGCKVVERSSHVIAKVWHRIARRKCNESRNRSCREQSVANQRRSAT